ncbi:23S rRNA (adenine(2503)-C(2))-methyltransferase RlmN [Arenibaculum pallidiluteum]|uniref:23S rRNA (adenine(2503)-C(2))-methyltransferase RlmN n=1 Tax=Arenibaculum pallidiluteum TaxID=2812559 RepID=UPI001A977E83|nr:23S rRNA (adenine(2503)-C(2))-methyltransferase RlmN [Arenibaculum pallidiluteum]
MGALSHAGVFAPPANDADGRRDIVGLDRTELTDLLVELGLEAFRARQVWHWIYHRGATDFETMTTLARPVRQRLAESLTIGRPGVSRDLQSEDGTRKWLLRMRDGQEFETVHIPEEDRGTLCVSSQVGCTLTCRFCHTGTQRLVRNLEAGEIVGQVMMARDAIGEWPAPKDGRLLSNIVMMGMGEPLYNYENVAKALRIVMDGEGIAISKRRITLSTSGVVPMMKRCGEELGVNLAVSLHAVTDELRDRIVPINRKYPLAELLEACRTYPGLSNARRITFEYVMLKGVNDSAADARELVRLLRGIPAKINLIPFNPWPGAPFERSDWKQIERFADLVNAAGYASPVRTPRGEDIMAACGQLKSDSMRLSAAERAAMAAVIAEKEAAQAL